MRAFFASLERAERMSCRGNGFYPGTGEVYDAGKGPGEGFNVNIPWQRGGLSDADYIAAFDLVSPPRLESYLHSCNLMDGVAILHRWCICSLQRVCRALCCNPADAVFSSK